jgi:LysM repeat protein
MTVSSLASLNGIKNVNFIRVGQVLKLAGTISQSAASKIVYYTVKKGDVVSVIAQRYGSTSAQIKSWNKLNITYVIYPGQKLRVK